jgi:hypothetical protein
VELQAEGPRRALVRAGRPVWTVVRTGEAPPFQTLELDNPALGLSVRIRTLED